jgi:hypothetical protein
MPCLRVAVLVGLLVRVNSAAAVEDELLPGTTLALRQGRKAERLVVVARAAISAPLPGGTDDPRFTGARVDIGNPETHEWARLDAPAAGWSLNHLGTLFRFRNHSPKERLDEPLQVVIRHGRRVKVASRAIGITLDEPAQQSLAVVITSGTRRYCLLFGGKVRRDEPGHFVAHAAPVPSSCPVPSENPTQTTSTTTTTRPKPGVSTTSTTTSTTAPGLPTSSSSTSTPPASSSTSSTASLPSTTSPPSSTTSTTQPPDDGDPCEDLEIPSGKRPPPGLCRIWFPGTSSGHQPPPGDCGELAANVPDGACLIRG